MGLLTLQCCSPQDDLLSLKVGSVLHHLSIKRAVQVLRLNEYQPNCLRRRPSDEVGLMLLLLLCCYFDSLMAGAFDCHKCKKIK